MDIKVNTETVIVFDLDDTLYNELDYLKSAYKSISKHLEPENWKPLYSKMFSLYRSKINVFEFLAESYKTDIKLLVDMYRHHQPDLQLFEGVLDVFEAIKSKNGKIAIITDGRSLTQRAKLKSLGILSYIDKVIISEEIGSEKPNIANFKAIENALSGSEYYYFADNLKKDFIAPNALGWKTVALIDNGKNIHFESHNFMTTQNSPEDYIINFKGVVIL
ncbi:HAD family hydrolase [Winogradskyella vidalii]|uniref:HAD family hydrolase n=1 Tax=Winogradskyella vidalii TaxID=2615024 RepID=UPI0015CA5FD2|nr:HAD family hydrolase [Winogradskyella vidalii]